MDIEPHIEERLKRLDVDFGKEWSLWEHKTFNIHRAVVLWNAGNFMPTISDIQKNIRQLIRGHFKVKFWRGFGFGSVIELSDAPDDINGFEKIVYQRDNRNGTWQWIIVIGHNSKKYISSHTWTKGYLTPVYETLLTRLNSSGYVALT